MHRRHVILCAILGLAIGAGAGTAIVVWRQQARTHAALAGVAAMPDLTRWPAELARRIREATAAVGRERNPRDPLARLAVLYHANGFGPQARQALDVLRQLEPANARWPYLLADLHLRNGENEAAEPALLASVHLAPDYVPAWLRLGRLRTARHALDAAREAFARAVAVAPGDVRAEYALIDFEARHGNRGDPRASLIALARAHPGIKHLHALLAGLHEVAGDPAGAARERALAAATDRQIGTEDPWADELAEFCFDSNRLSLRATELGREGRLAEAERLLARAGPLAPNDPILWGLLAQIHELQRHPAEARAVLEQAVAACPDDPTLPVQLARLLRTEGKIDDALAAIQRALRRLPAQAGLHAALGETLRKARRSEEAARALREAIRLDPTQTEAWFHLGVTLLEFGDRAGARAALEKAVAMRPDYAQALFVLGGLDIEAGDIAAAEPRVNRLYALSPEEPGARRLFAALHLLQGHAAAQAGDLDRADKLYRAGLAADPDFGNLLLEKGSLDRRRGRFADAVAAFEAGLSVAEKAGDAAQIAEFKRRLGR